MSTTLSRIKEKSRFTNTSTLKLYKYQKTYYYMCRRSQIIFSYVNVTKEIYLYYFSSAISAAAGVMSCHAQSRAHPLAMH
jgi:hypothetical protein